MTETEWKLPRKLRLTPKMRDDSAIQQIVWREQSSVPFGQPSEATRERSRASIRIAELETVLKDATDADTIAAIKSKLAQNYALVGRFDLAALSAQGEAKRAEYVEVLEALKRDDSESCLCAASNLYVKKEIWSPVHNRAMPLVACQNCGLVNVAPLPESVAKMRNARRKSFSLTKELDAESAKQILNDNNLTFEAIK